MSARSHAQFRLTNTNFTAFQNFTILWACNNNMSLYPDKFLALMVQRNRSLFIDDYAWNVWKAI